MQDTRSGDRVREWVRMTKVDRMMEERKSWKEYRVDEQKEGKANTDVVVCLRPQSFLVYLVKYCKGDGLSLLGWICVCLRGRLREAGSEN